MHIPRLTRIWSSHPIIFITTCTAGRKSLLATKEVVSVLCEEWRGVRDRHGWAVGRYVVMPDHVHFFVCPDIVARCSLSTTIGKWKEWTSRKIGRTGATNLPIWQAAFFDRVMRSDQETAEMWEYVQQNPVRAGLVKRPEHWPFVGAIDFETARCGPLTPR